MPVPTYLIRHHVEHRVASLRGVEVSAQTRAEIAEQLAELITPNDLVWYSLAANDNRPLSAAMPSVVPDNPPAGLRLRPDPAARTPVSWW